MMLDKSLFKKSERILCAVSGGMDSMAMLNSFQTIKTEYDLKLFVCHLNHKTRNGESDNDELFVRNYCKEHNIPYYFEEIQITETFGLGFEGIARKYRYNFFQRAVEHFKVDKICTAHNQNDNLETILLNFTRGTGLKGLCGIPKIRDNIIRPLLETSREKIEEYISSNNIKYVHDKTNDETDYTRNKIRKNVIPKLLEINPNLLETTTKTSNILTNDELFIESKVNIHYIFIDSVYTIKIKNLQENNEVIVFRFFKNILENFNKSLSFLQFKDLMSVINSSNPSAKLNIYKDLEISRNYDTIEIYPVKNEEQKLLIQDNLITIYSNKFTNLDFNCYADCDKIDLDSLHVTKRNQGDALSFSFGKKSLKKLFIDKKIPQIKRDFVPILSDKNGIIAVCFIGTDATRFDKKDVKINFRSIENA